MEKKYFSAKEFAKMAGVSFQTIYKQMNGRLAPFTKTVYGRRLISSDALNEFYRTGDQPDLIDSTDIQPDSSENQPDSMTKAENVHPESTAEDESIQPDSPEAIQPETKVESLLRQQLADKDIQLEKDREEIAYLRSHIDKLTDTVTQLSDKVGKLTDNIVMTQKILQIDNKILDARHQDIREAADPTNVQADDEQGENRLIKMADYFRSLFGRNTRHQ